MGILANSSSFILSVFEGSSCIPSKRLSAQTPGNPSGRLPVDLAIQAAGLSELNQANKNDECPFAKTNNNFWGIELTEKTKHE